MQRTPTARKASALGEVPAGEGVAGKALPHRPLFRLC